MFGKAKVEEIKPLTLNDKSLQFVTEWKYLGVTVSAGAKLSFSAKPALSAYYRAVNSILSVLRKPDELVLMKLLFSNCVPILTYGSETIEFSSSDMRNFKLLLMMQSEESTHIIGGKVFVPSVKALVSLAFTIFIIDDLKHFSMET